MAQIIIRNLDDAVVKALKAEAALSGRSMEAEARARLEESFKERKRKMDKQELIERFRQHRMRLGKVGGESTTSILRKLRDSR